MAQRFLSLHAKVAAMELLTCKLSEQILRAQVKQCTRCLLLLMGGYNVVIGGSAASAKPWLGLFCAAGHDQ
jgi:hypothetical protein